MEIKDLCKEIKELSKKAETSEKVELVKKTEPPRKPDVSNKDVSSKDVSSKKETPTK